MSSYSELIKNFEKIRAYMREFYVYGFKSRDGYDRKSLRSYDDERRRIESWLGDHMRFVRTADGKNVFISIDSRILLHNPFYRAWKAKSFTDGDITLHFILFDILQTPDIRLSIPEILQRMDDEYLSSFEEPMMFDESTVRKKLKEYCGEGLLVSEKEGKKMLYRRAGSLSLSQAGDVLDFFSEIAPCGVIGSFLLDRSEPHKELFGFKHHYMTSAMDSEVLATLFVAMRSKCAVSVSTSGHRSQHAMRHRIVPLRVFISVQSGRQHLLAYQSEYNCFHAFRLDYLFDVQIETPVRRFDELRAQLDQMQAHIWGVNIFKLRHRSRGLEHVEFTVRVEPDEGYIVQRLMREKRIGQVDQIDEQTYRFRADVYDTSEMIPWIRSFVCRIVQMNFSDRTLENRFRNDLKEMYRMYGIGEEGEE